MHLCQVMLNSESTSTFHADNASGGMHRVDGLLTSVENVSVGMLCSQCGSFSAASQRAASDLENQNLINTSAASQPRRSGTHVGLPAACAQQPDSSKTSQVGTACLENACDQHLRAGQNSHCFVLRCAGRPWTS
jgi:hypothetical protein